MGQAEDLGLGPLGTRRLKLANHSQSLRTSRLESRLLDVSSPARETTAPVMESMGTAATSLLPAQLAHLSRMPSNLSMSWGRRHGRQDAALLPTRDLDTIE